MSSSESIVVLGAGLQGVCVALALHRQGHLVTLVDKTPDCMLRASLRNEGKIHLGFVYANDASFRTSLLMLRSALAFAPLVEEWTGGGIDWATITSRPFVYTIARDSLLSPESLFMHYERLQKIYREVLETEESTYLGSQPSGLWQEIPLGTVHSWLDKKFVRQGVETVEVALDLVAFRAILRAALARADKIKKLYGHTVAAVRRTPHGFRVEGARADGSGWTCEAGIVVNCLWEGRLRLDQQMGVIPRRRWVYRLKYRVFGELPVDLAQLPSLTMVLGSYGDVVVYPSAKAYISWYPTCMKGWCTDLAPPRSWESICAGQVERELAAAVAHEALTAFNDIVPGILGSKVTVVDAGIIFSWGDSDISDPESELHERFDVGVQAYDGYYSIDTGKLTCAPFFARQLLQKLR